MIEEKTLTLTWYWNLSGKGPMFVVTFLSLLLSNSNEVQTLVFGSSRTWWGVCDEEKTVLMSVYVFSVLKSHTLIFFFSHAKLNSQFWWTTINKFEGNSISYLYGCWFWGVFLENVFFLNLKKVASLWFIYIMWNDKSLEAF